MMKKRTKERTHQSLLLLIILLLLLLLLVQSGPATSSGAPRQRGSPIRSIVVLVLENRSFDHMLGWMKRSLNPLLDGLTGSECNPISSPSPSNPNPNPNPNHPPFVCVSDDARFVAADPGHSFEDVLLQVFGPSSSSSSSSSAPSMAGFAEQALSISPELSATVMKGFDPSRLPAFETLAAHFAVFDRWFSSVPGPTQPNRLFLYSATSHGAVAHDELDLLRGYPQPTIFSSLRRDDLDFAVYFRSVPTTLFYRDLRRLKHVPNFHPYDRAFRSHAMGGRLPSLSVIEPRYFDVRRRPPVARRRPGAAAREGGVRDAQGWAPVEPDPAPRHLRRARRILRPRRHPLRRRPQPRWLARPRPLPLPLRPPRRPRPHHHGLPLDQERNR